MDEEKEFPEEQPQSEVIAEEHPEAESTAAEAIAGNRARGSRAPDVEAA